MIMCSKVLLESPDSPDGIKNLNEVRLFYDPGNFKMYLFCCTFFAMLFQFVDL